MTFRDVLALSALLAAAACAGTKDEAAPPDAFSALRFAEGPAPDAAPSPADANAYRIDVVFEKSDGTRLAMPRMIARPGQDVAMALGQPIEYVADFGVEMDRRQQEPVKRTILDGARIDACAQRAADGGITFGWRVAAAKVAKPIAEFTTTLASAAPVTIQLPDVTEVTAQGTRWIEPDVWAMLARLASPDGSGPMLVLARVAPIHVEDTPFEDVFAAGPPPGDLAPASDLARPQTRHTVHLRLSAVRTTRQFEPGTVLDETATPDVLKVAGGEILRDFEAFTCLDARVRLTASSGVAPLHGTAPFTAVFDDAGRLTITWNGRTASVRANEGRRFLAVAPIEGGGTAGVIVSVNADD